MIAVSDVTAWDSTADAGKAALAIAAVTKQIEGLLGYSLKWASVTDERVSSRGDQYLVLNRYPLHEVTAVKLDTEELEDWEQYENGDRWGWLYRECGWPACWGSVRLTGDSKMVGRGILKATYSAGYQFAGQELPDGVSGVPTVPEDLKMHVIDLVLLRLGKRSIELGGKQVLSQSVGAMRIQYAESRLYSSSAKMQADILSQVARDYKRPELP